MKINWINYAQFTNQRRLLLLLHTERQPVNKNKTNNEITLFFLTLSISKMTFFYIKIYPVLFILIKFSFIICIQFFFLPSQLFPFWLVLFFHCFHHIYLEFFVVGAQSHKKIWFNKFYYKTHKSITINNYFLM